MPSQYKFSYFSNKGLGEPVRFLLSYLGEDFEDSRFEKADWVNIKPTTPWGKSPVLEVDGKLVTQSMAITRYLGRLAGLNGKDAWEDLKIDEIVGVIDDLRGALAKFEYEPDPKRQEEIKIPLSKEIVPFYMKKLDAHIESNNGYLANGKLSWADLWFTAILDYLSHMNRGDLTTGYPNVKKLTETVLALPAIKAWVDKRPESAN